MSFSKVQKGEIVQTFFAESSEDIERICEAQSEVLNPADVFVVTNPNFVNSVLAVQVTFLERGQTLEWPRLRLLGATFDPDWGFSDMAIARRPKDKGVFCLPPLDPRELNYGNTNGYRFCPLEIDERMSTELELGLIIRALDRRGC